VQEHRSGFLAIPRGIPRGGMLLALAGLVAMGGCASGSYRQPLPRPLQAVLGPPALPYKLSGSTATFTVRINDRMNDGTSWRGSGAVFLGLPGGITPQVEVANAPSPLLFMVASDGTWSFIGNLNDRDSVGHPKSPCHLSYDCEFMDVPLPQGELFAIVLASTGIIAGDLVDAAIFSHKKTGTRDPAYQAFNATLHQTVEQIVPSNTSDERRRRQRPFPIVTMEDCIGVSCTLRQSIVKLEMP